MLANWQVTITSDVLIEAHVSEEQCMYISPGSTVFLAPLSMRAHALSRQCLQLLNAARFW